jgi:hypothetical protein
LRGTFQAAYCLISFRKIRTSWSPVTESNRRPSPYHVQLSRYITPGRAPDQHIRWHRLAETSPDQRRRAPFCPSKCPSGPAPSGPATPATRRSAAHSSEPVKSTRGSARTRGTSELWHLALVASGQRGRPGQPASRQPTDPDLLADSSQRGRLAPATGAVPRRPDLVDMPVIVRHQDRGALRLDHRHDQAFMPPKGSDLIFDHRHNAETRTFRARIIMRLPACRQPLRQPPGRGSLPVAGLLNMPDQMQAPA